MISDYGYDDAGSLNDRFPSDDYDDNEEPEKDEIPFMSDDVICCVTAGTLPENMISDYEYDDAETQPSSTQDKANGLSHPPAISISCDYDDADLGD
ncbi:hypothetical protein XENTR_v10022218 [Xenopus tropicalis]|nr:hypothetical protein XENTR_v10022218 [Xenopus tropicalis]